VSANSPGELRSIYSARFAGNLAYRQKIWNVLIQSFFQKYIARDDVVLDLGCGYGEFINAVQCREKLAIDLNPDAPRYLDPTVRFLEQDCSSRWRLEDGSLNLVFTSNFFEHLPDKAALGRTLDEIFRCLTPGGELIAMGPNIKHLPGKYWDFWDHHLALTETSLSEGLTNRGFEIGECIGKFLPYTMVKARQYPESLLKLYLTLPIAWRVLGKQFLVVAAKPAR
jgi:Methylase involved in ubiquinone/menaquinone biosynthesis